MKRIAVVAGARPNFMKVAPILRACAARDVEALLVHTGQHYDASMSGSFFDVLGLPEADVNFGVGSGTHAVQTAGVMTAFEAWLEETPVDAIVVVGDVNSTMACSVVGAKLGVPVAHVEAGLRSFDRTMPEEVNRVVTDGLATWLFATTDDAVANLLAEGADPSRIFMVGNVMSDSLLHSIERARERRPWVRLDLPEHFGLITLHRPALVDNTDRLNEILKTLAEIAPECPFVFPIHPRTLANIERAGLDVTDFHMIDPLDYLDFLAMQERAAVVVTDSGGVQEETSLLGTWCVTVRENTERSITVTHGTNTLVGFDLDRLRLAVTTALDHGPAAPASIPLWDGKAAERIVDVLLAAPQQVEWIPPITTQTASDAYRGVVLLSGRNMAISSSARACVGVVIVTFNSSAHLEQLTTSLDDALKSIPHRVVAVDNASSDDTVALLRGKGIDVIEMGRNAGYSAGINAGLDAFPDASAVLILNPDVSLAGGAAAELHAALSDPSVGVVVPQTRQYSGELSHNQRRDPSLSRAFGSAVLGAERVSRWSLLSETVSDPAAYLHPTDIDWGVGAVMMISRKCIDAVGRWDESFFLYSEETEYCQRARRHGLRVRYVPAAVVFHEGGGGVGDKRLRSMMTVNKVRLYGRQHSRAATFAFLAASFLYEGTRGIGGSAAARAAAVALVRPSRRPPELQCCDSFLPS